MASFNVTYTFVANTKARSSEVNRNFNDVLGILQAHHHDPNIYPGAAPITNSGIADNAQIRDTQMKYPITRSGLINYASLDNVPVAKGGLGMASASVGDMIVGSGVNTYKRIPLGTAGQVWTAGSILPSWQDPPPSIFNYFGDGSDGDVIISGDTQISRDMYYNNLTLSGGNLDTNGYKVFVRGTLTINVGYKIYIAVNAGGNGTNGGVGSTTAGGSGGSGGGAGNTGTVYGGKVGAGGGNGAVGLFFNNAPGGTGSVGSNGATENVSLTQTAGVSGATGGSAGAGGPYSPGSGGGGGSGGSAGTAPLFGTPHNWLSLFRFLDPTTALWAAFAHYKGSSSSGGGGGGGSAGGGSGSSAGGGGGGGSGSSAGIVYVAAYAIINNGTIQAKGGQGGNGGRGGNADGSITNGGGGGGGASGSGGQGGVIVLIYHTLSGSGTTDVSGGAPGTPGAGGTHSGSGSDGATGSTGSTGNAGLVLSYVV